MAGYSTGDGLLLVRLAGTLEYWTPSKVQTLFQAARDSLLLELEVGDNRPLPPTPAVKKGEAGPRTETTVTP